MHDSRLDALATKFFAAIESKDLATVREIYADQVEVWHNVTGRVQTREENLRLLETFTNRVSDMRYEVTGRDFFVGGFVQRHILHGRTTSDELIAAAVCIVIYVEGDQIVRLFEYLDATSVAAAFAEKT